MDWGRERRRRRQLGVRGVGRGNGRRGRQGASPGAGDSGAKISLLINAANRALAPFTRHHAQARKAMAAMMLDVNKRVGIDTHISVRNVDDKGNVRPLRLKIGDHVLFGPYAGTPIQIEGHELLVMREGEVAGRITE